MKTVLLLCSMLITQVSYNMSDNPDDDFTIHEICIPFNPDKGITTINYAELLKIGLDALTKDPSNVLSAPENILQNHMPIITSHLLLKASACENDFTEQWVSLLLVHAANPLLSQKISAVTYAKNPDIGMLVPDELLYNEPIFETAPCHTALFLALQHRNVPAVRAMLHHNPSLALATYNEQGSNYANYVDWLCQYAVRSKEELNKIQELFLNAQQQLQQSPTS